MKRIRLIPIDGELAETLKAGAESFARRYNGRLGGSLELAGQVVAQTLALCERVPREPMWGGYLVADEETHQVIGTCGFPAGPSDEGEVEIAYCTFPAYERQGYATATAGRLTAMAESSPAVRQVIAHTLPEPNTSTRVLQRNGFTLRGEVNHPEDGLVWRWERPRVKT